VPAGNYTAQQLIDHISADITATTPEIIAEFSIDDNMYLNITSNYALTIQQSNTLGTNTLFENLGFLANSQFSQNIVSDIPIDIATPKLLNVYIISGSTNTSTS
jgi:hypothetical protein